MEDKQKSGIDAASVNRWYDDFENRWMAYVQILSRVREVAKLFPDLTMAAFKQQADAIDDFVAKVAAEYDRDNFAEVCQWLEEQRQQAGWEPPLLNGQRDPTALQLARFWFWFVAAAWLRTKSLGWSPDRALSFFWSLFKEREPPRPDDLHIELSKEHTLARRALKVMAVPQAKHDDAARIANPRQEKLKARDKQIKLLCKTHKLNGKWAELVKLANNDPVIKQLELKPVTKDIARNIIEPPHLRRKK